MIRSIHGPAGPERPPGEAADGSPSIAADSDFDHLVERHGVQLFALACRLSGSGEDAEALSQEAMVRAQRDFGRFRGEADDRVRLYQIVLDLWRKKAGGRRLYPLSAWGRRSRRGRMREAEAGEGGRRPGERAPGGDRARRLQAALVQIEPDLRAVLILRVAEDMDYEQIAAVLEIPIGKVRSRLARARSRIRQLMTE